MECFDQKGDRSWNVNSSVKKIKQNSMIDNDPLSESKDGSNNLIHIDNLDEYNYHLTSPKNDDQQFKEELLSESFTNGSRNHQ